MDPKLLTERGWKDIAGKSKVEDNGLQQALAAYEKLAKDKRAERLKAIASVSLLAGKLNKDKEVAAVPLASKYLANVVAAAEAERQDINDAEDEATIAVTIRNGSDYDDIFLTVEDLNRRPAQVIVNRARLNKKKSLPITLQADGDHKGQIHWTAELAEDAASTNENTEKYIKQGQIIKVSVS
jgi:hypothetical protein